MLEPDDGKPSSPVLRGLGASNGARPLDSNSDGRRAISTGSRLVVRKSKTDEMDPYRDLVSLVNLFSAS